MIRKPFAIIWLMIACGFTAGAQQYPQDYFRNPLDIPILLAGNFGECRPNHFHTGLDLKTNEKENLPVYAAAEGYVSRISISHSGYGNALYINHPNGYTTVYGHLNDFFPALQQYLMQQQYSRERWDIDITLKPGDFPVKKGQLVAYSGTTGGSTGPHLHFEIRDSRTEHVLNGALFGLPITDRTPPVAKGIALYKEGSVYEQQPVLITLKKNGPSYTTTAPVSFKDDVLRIAVLADDYMEGSPNTLGVYSMTLYMDGQLQASWSLDNIDFDENRYVNAYADFRIKEEKGRWYQTLFRTPGNKLSNYQFLNKERGALRIGDGKPHDIRIELSDAAGNTSDILFTVTGQKTATTASPSCNDRWKAGAANALNTATLSFKTYASALYDDLCFRYSEQAAPQKYSSVVQLHNSKIPLHSFSELRIKLNKSLPRELADKLVFVHHIKAATLPGNNPQDAAAATFSDGWAQAYVRTFGSYFVAADTVAPVVKPLQKGTDMGKAKQLRFTVTDNLTSVKQFRAELDGRWLRFVRSGNTYTYTFDSHCAPGRHTLLILATDENNNTRRYSFQFTR